jgi:hypothetical protein
MKISIDVEDKGGLLVFIPNHPEVDTTIEPPFPRDCIAWFNSMIFNLLSHSNVPQDQLED